MVFRSKNSYARARSSFRRHFPSSSFYSSKPISPQKQLFLKVKCHIGGKGGKSEKGKKKCHVLFEWPLYGQNYINIVSDKTLFFAMCDKSLKQNPFEWKGFSIVDKGRNNQDHDLNIIKLGLFNAKCTYSISPCV